MRLSRRDALKFLGVSAALIALPTYTYWRKDLNYCLGKRPAREGAVKLRFRDYVDLSQLPKPPASYGNEKLISDWQVLGNDRVGDCAIAGPMHAMMLWNAEANKTFNTNTDITLAAYSAITGYNPNDPSTDQGSDVVQVAEYWQQHGITDADGVIHKIDAYVALEPRNIDELWAAMYLFDGVGIGVEFPQEWMEAFREGQNWDALPQPTVEGGHYILGVGRRKGCINVVTWGRTQLLTPAGYEQFNDETLVYLSEEKLVNGKDINGFDLDQLRADLADLRS